MPLDSLTREPNTPLAQDNITAPDASRFTSPELSKTLIRLKNDIEDLDKERRLKLYRNMIKGHQYYDGNFYGYVDLNGEWIPRQKAEGEIWYQDNQFYSYIRTALMEMSRRETKIQAEAADDGEDDTNAAKFWQSRIDKNRNKTFTAHLKQTENAYALLNGITSRYTFFDFKNNRKEKIPRFENGEDGTVIGYDDLPSGENKWVVPNPVSVIFSMQASTLQESPFIKWKQLVLRSVLEYKFPNLKLPSTGVSAEMQYVSNQQTATPADRGGSLSGDSAATDGGELEILEFQQIWLDHAIYCNIKFSVPCRMANGKTLPANTPLGELFPDGLYYACVGDLIVDIWNEDKNTKWTSSPYSLRAGSMYGAGTTAAHAQQELINDLKALEMANAWTNSVPREFVDEQFIDELSADPSVVTRVHDMPDSANIIGRAYAQASPATLSSEIYGLEQNAKGSMQNQIGALSNDAAGGLSDTQAAGNTATAITIRRQLAVGRFAPDLELLADNLDRAQALQFIRNEQKFFTPDQWRKAAGDYGEDAMKRAREMDLETDLIITVVSDSYMPKSPEQRIAAFQAYAEFKAQMGQLLTPELDAYAAEIYNIDQSVGGWQSDKIEVRQLIGRFAELAEMSVNQNGDAPDSDLTNPQIKELASRINSYAGMPVDVWLDNHNAMIDALRDWRLTDEGRNASNTLLAAVAYRLNLHSDAMVAQAQADAQRSIAAQVPMQQMQEQAQQKQLAAQNETEAAQAETANQAQSDAEDMETVNKLVELDEAENVRDHEAEQNERDRQRDIEVAKIQANEKISK